MHRLGGSPWRATEGASREVLVALYVRDALGIVDPSGLPRLLGTGLTPPRAAPDAVVGWAWTRWWASIVEPGIEMPGPPEEALDLWRSALRRHLDSARTYAAIAHDDHGIRSAERSMAGLDDLTLTELVAEREAERGSAADFDLRIEVLPLTARGIWWIAESAIAVDEELREDLGSYRAALRPIVERLVRD
ncbi:MAG TPA: hypothetical protein VNR36_12520 [Pseudolysinimonas sp.]|nr:hypothetical protein [Pseudolysinimonas sp.]